MPGKLLTALSLALTLSNLACAQTTHSAPSATEQTREMANCLHLNEGEFVKLYTLNRTRETRQQEIEQGTKHDPGSRAAQLAELQSQYEQECGRIMSPSQLSQLLQQEASPTADGGNN